MAQNRIRMLRKESGYNQKELGEILGVGQTTVSAWEIGRNEPDNALSHKMANMFGCSIGYLMGFEGESGHRGLSETEWHKYTTKKHNEIENEREHKQILQELEQENHPEVEDEDIDAIMQEWENNERAIFPETAEIDTILERLDAKERRRAVNILKAAFQ